ncbi:hypothetical protein BKA70DRAFT_1405464 [Coprinopsis sp. MPI-PUGE-AT-0042]|nr:hypothetical protein BKA70DRAFT_1405464 [Coprinopsis sp. MPI-PUGE-AT-0042]
MSLFKPDLWFPDAIQYPVELLSHAEWLPDYIVANILTAIFLITSHFRHRRRASQERKGQSWASKAPVSVKWCCISLALTFLYATAAIAYWTAFGKRYASVETLKDFTGTEEQALQWFDDNPGDKGVKVICIPGSSDPYRPPLCHRLYLQAKHTRWVKHAAVALGIAALGELSPYRHNTSADQRVSDKTSPIMGIVVLAKVAELGVNTEALVVANFTYSKSLCLLAWNSPLIAIECRRHHRHRRSHRTTQEEHRKAGWTPSYGQHLSGSRGYSR